MDILQKSKKSLLLQIVQNKFIFEITSVLCDSEQKIVSSLECSLAIKEVGFC